MSNNNLYYDDNGFGVWNNKIALMKNHQRQMICVEDGVSRLDGRLGAGAFRAGPMSIADDDVGMLEMLRDRLHRYLANPDKKRYPYRHGLIRNMIIDVHTKTLNCASDADVMDMRRPGQLVHHRSYHIHARVFSRDLLHHVKNILWRSEDERGILLGIVIPEFERYRGNRSNQWLGKITANEYGNSLAWGQEQVDLTGLDQREVDELRTVYFYGPYAKVARLLLDFLDPVLSDRWRPVADAFGIHDCDVDVNELGVECLHGYKSSVLNQGGSGGSGYGVGFEIREFRLGRIMVMKDDFELAALRELRRRIKLKKQGGEYVPSEGYLVRVEYDSRYPRDQRLQYAFTGLRGMAEVIRRYCRRVPTTAVGPHRRLRDGDSVADASAEDRSVRMRTDDGGAESGARGGVAGAGWGAEFESESGARGRRTGMVESESESSSDESLDNESRGGAAGVEVPADDDRSSSIGNPEMSHGGYAGAAFDDEMDDDDGYDSDESDNHQGESLEEFLDLLAVVHNSQ